MNFRIQKLLSTEQEITNFSDLFRNYQILFFVLIDIPGLLLKLGVNEYKPEEWILFIDSSKNTLSKSPGEMHPNGFPGR